MSKGMKKIGPGRYQLANGIQIEKRAKERRGRTGFALAGWSIIRDGREIGRWSTLARAAEEAKSA